VLHSAAGLSSEPGGRWCSVSKLTVETDHMKPMVIPAGSDKLTDIGLPGKGGTGSGALHACREWRDTLYKIYPPPKTEEKKAVEKCVPSGLGSSREL
jgi:hypothetical protein